MDDDGARRADLMDDLGILNMELRRLGVPVLISEAAALLYPPDDLPALIRATRVYLAKTARDLAGLA